MLWQGTDLPSHADRATRRVDEDYISDMYESRKPDRMDKQLEQQLTVNATDSVRICRRPESVADVTLPCVAPIITTDTVLAGLSIAAR